MKICDKCGCKNICTPECRKCGGTGNIFWMENVRNITIQVDQLIEDELKKFNITLTDKEEDEIYNKVWKVLESKSNGYYKNHN